MSVWSAAAKVGTEIMNTRVEIPAMVTPMTELMSTEPANRRRYQSIAVNVTGQCH